MQVIRPSSRTAKLMQKAPRVLEFTWMVWVWNSGKSALRHRKMKGRDGRAGDQNPSAGRGGSEPLSKAS